MNVVDKALPDFGDGDDDVPPSYFRWKESEETTVVSGENMGNSSYKAWWSWGDPWLQWMIKNGGWLHDWFLILQELVMFCNDNLYE